MENLLLLAISQRWLLLEWQGQSRSTTADRSRGIRGKVSPQLGGRGDGAHVAGAAEGVGRDGGGVGVVVSGVAVAAVAAWAHGTDDDVGAPRQLARSAAGDCQFSPTEPVKPTKRAQFGLYLVVHAHTPLRDWMRSTTSTGTESRGHQSTPDHGGVPPCCLPVIRRNVPADAARSDTHMQDLSRDEKQRSNRPISDRLRRWISARNGRPRSDHDRVVMGRLSLAVRLPQF